MLEVDLSKTDKQIVDFVTARCKPFGPIKSINLYRTPRPYAIVRMEDRRHASTLAIKLGKRTFDGAVIIMLMQRRTHVDY